MNQEIILLHISLIEGIGPITVKKMLQKMPYGFDYVDLYKLKESDFVTIFGFSKSVALKLVSGLKDKSKVKKEYELIKKNKINFVTVVSENYPELLKNIYAPPVVLYWQGADLLSENKKIAFVGSRKAHRYAERAIERIVPDIVSAGWIVVSGGAIGADSMAHREAVHFGGKTIAVLGSGLLHPYPSSNKRLFEQIIQKGGALVSSFSLQTIAKPGNFPSRNRVIAGLSLGCVVVQAAQKSGASITAQLALDEGREVFAIPGPIDDELSVGCHSLIKQGAKLVSDSSDILTELSHYYPSALSSSIDNETLHQAVIFQDDEDDDSSRGNQTIESVVTSCCSSPCSIDDLVIKTDIAIGDLHEILFDLQISGRIKQNHAGMWERS